MQGIRIGKEVKLSLFTRYKHCLCRKSNGFYKKPTGISEFRKVAWYNQQKKKKDFYIVATINQKMRVKE